MASNKNKSLVRRKLVLLTGVSGIAGLTADVWLKPVVNSVVLPVHAQTSMGPVMAVLEGVEDGEINTEFTVQAGSSSSSDSASLSYVFTIEGNCELVSQSDGSAVIRRGLLAGECIVTVVISDGETSDTVSVTSTVTGGPPGTPLSGG